VDRRLVDSYFGNISYVYDDRIFISQTGSSMDELEGCIDAVPLDGSSSVGITASSELSAHRSIYAETASRAILHGHPKFAVIMSMVSSPGVCTIGPGEIMKDRIAGIPVVSGDIGTGPSGLMHTVPAAMREGRGAIVYGHGVFTAGAQDFREPFERLCAIEQTSRDEYGRRVRAALEALSR
jgi:ribulose-5-phosphate 4-epimerase/fuculose-1-phosphate aldolase